MEICITSVSYTHLDVYKRQEYGFEAVPSMKTLRTVIHENQFNIVSPEMEKHQKCIDNGPGNVTLMYYLLQYYQLPATFERTVYATQSLQSDFLEMAIRHFQMCIRDSLQEEEMKKS